MAESKIKNNAPGIIRKGYTCRVTSDLDPRGHMFLSAAQFGITPIEGYEPLMIHAFFTSNPQQIDVCWVDATASGSVMGLCTANQSAVTTDFTATIWMAWVRSDLIGR